tara:strand:+ start:99802 stop:100659 length:858 start_codon:yes stop_codon:yes gene_type:complete
MKITIAKDAGYCFGVRDAVNIAYDTSKVQGDVYMLGDIVHNEKVVADLSKVGTKVVESIDDIPNDKPVLFRAHGTSEKIWKEAKDKNIDIIDATCPLVKEIHEEVERLEKDGRQIFIIGDHGHDEVVGIESHSKKPIVISNTKEAEQLRRYKRAGVVSQSTQTIENVQKIINILMTKVYDLHFINTICFPTKRNQSQIKELAKDNDLMIIIGSFTSANSKRLTELSININPNTFQVNGAKDLKQKWFRNVKSVGISAGASTPDYLIDEVQAEINKISNGKKETNL